MTIRLRIEPCEKRVRVYFGGVAVADTTRARLVWAERPYPTYYFPVADVRMELLRATGDAAPSPSSGVLERYDVRAGDRVASGAAYRHSGSLDELDDLIAFTWAAMDHWFEEDEEVYVHARSPYTRVDVLPSSRTVRVEVDGVVVARSTHPTLLFETGLPTRYYFAKPDVRLDLLVPTAKATACPYKGTARYWSVVVGDAVHADLAWAYDHPLPESIRIAGLISFYNERVDLFVDGERRARPVALFS